MRRWQPVLPRRKAGTAPAAGGTESRLPEVALVVDAIFPYHLGGREVRYHEVSRRLADGATMSIYTMRWWQGHEAVVDGNVSFYPISRLRSMYRSGGRRSIWQAAAFSAGCVRLLWRRFDVLEADHIPYLHILVLRVIASVRRKRFVVTWHEVWGREYWFQYLGRSGRIAWLIEWLAMRLPDHIIAASPGTADRLRSALGARASISVAPNGVDLDIIDQVPAADDRTDLVVVGRLIYHKRVDLLLDALAILHAQGQRVTCRVIGDGPGRDEVHRQATRLGLADSIDFRDDVREQKDVYALVKAASVAVFPSEREGFGAAVLEALACGVPVLTTSAPDNLAQVLASRSVRGYVCDPTPAALAESLSRMLAEPPAPADLTDSWLAEYSWDAVAGQVRQALQI